MGVLLELRVWLLWLIPAGVVIRIILCLIYMAASDDPLSYKKKIKHALIFLVVAECIVGLSSLLDGYFSTGSIIQWPE